MNLGDIDAKWNAFGWFTQHVNGHDYEQLSRAIEAALKETEMPSMIILDTIKAKGACFAEGDFNSHYMPVEKKTIQEAIERLGIVI
jgi:transketolase